MGQRIDVNHENIYYGDFLAVEDVNINIEPNKVTAFIGPSGCGKSTLLRTFNRMCDFVDGVKVEGLIKFRGEDIFKMDANALRVHVGMVFQHPNPFPMSIRDNILYGPNRMGKLTKEEGDDICEQTLTEAALWDEVKDTLDKSGLGLSGGQQQRLCIARTLAVQPDVLLMDEPCSAIDPTSVQKVEDLMAELAPEMTIIIVTHNMQQAARVSDYMAFFLQEHAGEPAGLVEYGDTSEIFNSPRDQRTEDYITGRFG